MKKDSVQVSLTKKQLNNLKKGKGVILKKEDLDPYMENVTKPIRELKPIRDDKTFPVISKPIMFRPTPIEEEPTLKLRQGTIQKGMIGLGSRAMTFQKGHPMLKSASGFRPPGY